MSKDNKSIKRVVGYIRLSTERSAESDSPEVHHIRIKEYCKWKGWELITLYEDLAYSGVDNSRPEYQLLKKSIPTGKFDAIIVSKLDRLGRSTKELIEIAELCKKHNVSIVSLGESIDTSTPSGIMFYTLIAAFAQFERDTTSERVKASVPIRARQGKPLGGQGIYGYEWKPIPGDEKHKKLVPIEKEARVRRLLYQLFIKHKRLRTVARMLSEKGYRTRKNRLFTDTTVRRLIQDLTAKGIHIANYTKSRGNKKTWELKPREEWVEVRVDPIVDEETWEKANQILKENSRRRVTKPRTYLLSGLVYCGMCGAKMYGHPGSKSDYPKYKCSKCKNKIKTNELEDIIIKELTDHTLKPEHISKTLEEQKIPLNKELDDIEKLLEQTNREITQIENKVSKLMDGWLEEKITDEEAFNTKLKALQNRKRQLKDEVPKLETKLIHLKVQRNSRDFVLEQARSFTAMFSILNEEERKALLERLLEKIVVSKDTINYSIYFLPEFHKNIPHVLENTQHTRRGSLQPRA